MNYTHPDILKMERDGYLDKPKEKLLGRCDFCGDYIYENDKQAVESMDYIFCCEACCYKYYGIKHIVER